MDDKSLDIENLCRLDAHALKGEDAVYHFVLDFLVFQQDGAYIAYCPSLDLSACANTSEEAVKNFYEMFQLHVETCVECGTLQEDFTMHGWKMQKGRVTPPAFFSLIRKSEVRKLFKSNTNFERITKETSMPAFA